MKNTLRSIWLHIGPSNLSPTSAELDLPSQTIDVGTKSCVAKSLAQQAEKRFYMSILLPSVLAREACTGISTTQHSSRARASLWYRISFWVGARTRHGVGRMFCSVRDRVSSSPAVQRDVSSNVSK